MQPRRVMSVKGRPVADFQVGAHVSSSGGVFKAIANGEAIEAEALQIFVGSRMTWRPTNHKPEAIAKFRELHEASNIDEVWIHNIYLANLATDDPEQLTKSIDSVVTSLSVGSELGVQGVVLHTGSHKGRGFDAVETQIAEALTSILDRAPDDVVLALENAAGQGGTIGTEFDELGRLIKAVGSDRLVVCLDTCHAFAAGYDLRTVEALDITMQQFDDAIGVDRLAVVHANDCKVELGDQRDRHDNIGDGHIGYDGWAVIAAHAAFQGKALILEVPGVPDEEGGKGDGPDLENVNRLKKIRDER